MKLSPRQKQIAELIADGNKTPAIAKMLGLKVGTVRNHIVRLKAKKGLRSQNEITRWVISRRTSRVYNDTQVAP